MNTDTLRARVEEYFDQHADTFQLDRARLVVDYVLNRGGFVNWSYRVRDGRTGYHLKLATSAEARAELRRWLRIAPLLERYRAPPILGWIDVGSAAGLLFPVIGGVPPVLDATIVYAIVPLLAELNADRRVAAALAPAVAQTAYDAYAGTFHERFSEDLRGVRGAPPPFVDADLLDWLGAQAGELLRLAGSMPAFGEHLTGPVHGDLWLDNILWRSIDDWHLIDWDDVRIGDPAADIATMLGPTAGDLRPLKLVEHARDALSPSARERLPLLGRATLLDWVIDPLADWVEAHAAPAHLQAVREEKRSIHERALALYAESYQSHRPGP